LPPPFDPTEVWQEMHSMANVVHEAEHSIHVLEAKNNEVHSADTPVLCQLWTFCDE
jgi:hypothetical protein